MTYASLRWVWRAAWRQWATCHDRAVYSVVMTAEPPGGRTHEETTYQDVATHTPRAMKAGEALLCKTPEGRSFSMKMPNDLPANMRITAKVRMYIYIEREREREKERGI